MNAPITADPTISASAIESYDPELEGCPRLWAWVRIDGLEKPQHPSARLGDGVHKQHEAYLIDGMPYDLSTLEGRIAHTTMHLLPNPGQAEVEKPFKFKWEGITWGGRKDFRYWGDIPSSTDVPTNHAAPLGNCLHVGDHKTTSNFQYAKNTREKLLGHPQAPLYALSEFETATIIVPDVVRLEWNYAKTGIQWETDDDGNFLLDPAGNYRYKVRSRPVALDPPVRELVTRPEAETAMRKFLPVARAMVDTLKNGCKTALELAPNPDVCNARKFGKKGCPFKSRCNLSAEVIAQAAFARLLPGPTEEESGVKKMDPLEAFLAKNRPGPANAYGPGPDGRTQLMAVQPVAATADVAPVVKLETSPIPAVAQASAEAYQNSQQAAIAAAGDIFKAPAINPPENGAFVEAKAEPPTQPETPKARRGRPPGKAAAVEGGDAWDRIATALEKIAEALSNSGKAA